LQRAWLLIGFAGSDVIERVSREFLPDAKISGNSNETNDRLRAVFFCAASSVRSHVTPLSLKRATN